jgi:excisionase family DNA binding protein
MATGPSNDEKPVRVESSSELVGEFLTVAEIAAILKVPVSWVYERTRRRGRDRIPHFKLGKYLRFHAPRVRAWLQALEEL